MRLYYVFWYDCINNKQFVIINARSKREADKRFDKWCEDNPDKAPGSYSPRSISVKDCVLLNTID